MNNAHAYPCADVSCPQFQCVAERVRRSTPNAYVDVQGSEIAALQSALTESRREVERAKNDAQELRDELAHRDDKCKENAVLKAQAVTLTEAHRVAQGIAAENADEIEKLTAELERTKNHFQWHHIGCGWRESAEEAQAEVTRLKAALSQAQERIKDTEAVGNYALAVRLDGNTPEWLLGLEKSVEDYNAKYPDPTPPESEARPCPNCKHPAHDVLCWAVKNEKGVATCPCEARARPSGGV